MSKGRFHRPLGVLAIALFVVLGTQPAAAQQGAEPRSALEPIGEEQLERMIRERVEQVRARLELTEEQESQARPILQQQLRKIAETRNKMRANQHAPRSEFVAMREELGVINRESLTQLDAVFDPEQMAEYQKLQAEWRDEIRRLARERRGRPEGS